MRRQKPVGMAPSSRVSLVRRLAISYGEATEPSAASLSIWPAFIQPTAKVARFDGPASLCTSATG